MKRKLFSAILFGALLTASTSGLTSCKDYDDDISNLQSQIDKLATADQLSAKVSEMQAAISAAQSAAEAKAAAAQTVADAAKAAAADAAAAASKAQGAADDAAKAAAAAAEVGKAAQAAVDKLAAEAATKAELEAAKEAAAAAVKAIEEAHAADKAAIEKAIADGLDAVKAEIAKTNEELAALAKRLDACEEKLAAIEAGEGQEEALKAIQEEVEAVSDALEAIIGEYTSMVTAVDLYVGGGAYDLYYALNNELRFVYVDQEKDTKFPAAEGVADEQITFSSANKNVMTTDKLVVRVSPTNAVLNAANISLLNSQGADLSDYVEVKAVKPFEELILGSTRAAEGNGLWEVEFKVKDGVDAAKFAEAVTVKKGLTTYGIKYAVAVQNTESDETRRVISAYDVQVLPEDYEPATTDIAISNRDDKWTTINGIRNRYDFVKADKPGNIHAESATEDGEASELAWVNEPDVAGGSEPTVQDQNDERFNMNLIDVEVGKSINIYVGAEASWSPADYIYASNPKNETSDVVKGFYVTLDSDNAIESSPSEINAWESYSYTNVGVPGDSKRPAKLFYGNEGSISIDSPAALGDIIGFRVYVVNLDGTLVDPDGRAFYVNVATEKVVAKLAEDEVVAELVPAKVSDGIYDYHFNGTNLVGEATLTAEAKKALKNGDPDAWTITSNASAYGNNVVDVEYDEDFVIDYDTDKGKVWLTIKTPYKFLDNGTYTAQTTVKKDNGTEICDLTVSFKKVLPENAPALGWNSLYNPAEQIFANVEDITNNADIYKIGAGTTPKAIELNKAMEFLNYGSGVAGESWYTLYFANSALDDKGKATKATQVPAKEDAPSVTGPDDVNDPDGVYCEAGEVTDYVFAPANKAIDGKAHAIDYDYNFGWLSLTFNKQTAAYTMSEWVKPAAKTLSMTFASWIDYEKIAWNGNAPSVTYSPGHDGEVAATISLLGSAGAPGTTTAQEVKQGVFVVIETPAYYKKLSNGNYYKCDNTGAVYKAADTPFTDQSEANIMANISLATEMPANTTYAEFDAENGIVVAYAANDVVYKKVSNGDWYAVAYDTTAKAWKFLKNNGTNPATGPSTTILDNQTETNVIANGWKAADGATKYEVIMVQDVTGPATPATASKLIAWNTLIRNIQSGKSMFGESDKKPVDFMSLQANDYIKNIKVEADGASPFVVTLVGSDLVFTNKTGTLNPSTSGTLKISAEDCFGNAHSWTLPYTIVK